MYFYYNFIKSYRISQAKIEKMFALRYLFFDLLIIRIPSK